MWIRGFRAQWPQNAWNNWDWRHTQIQPIHCIPCLSMSVSPPQSPAGPRSHVFYPGYVTKFAGSLVSATMENITEKLLQFYWLCDLFRVLLFRPPHNLRVEPSIMQDGDCISNRIVAHLLHFLPGPRKSTVGSAHTRINKIDPSTKFQSIL